MLIQRNFCIVWQKTIEQRRKIQHAPSRTKKATLSLSQKELWKEYFKELLNVEEEVIGAPVEYFHDINTEEIYENITAEEVHAAIQQMKSGKAVVVDGIPVVQVPQLLKPYKNSAMKHTEPKRSRKNGNKV